MEHFGAGPAFFAASGVQDRRVGLFVRAEPERGHHHRSGAEPAGLRVVSEVGTRLPLHCTSQGKVFLAAMPESEAIQILKLQPLSAYTPHTQITWKDLAKDLDAARRHGYAVEDGEYKIGLGSVSAPIRDASGQVKYAVGIIGMFYKAQSREFQDALLLTQATAAQISSAMGYRQGK